MTDRELKEIADLIGRRIAENAEAEARARRANLDIDPADPCAGGDLARIEAAQRQSLARAAAERRRRETLRLEHALARTADPGFGQCAGCGEQIPLARLRIDPAARRCAACAA